MGFLAASTIAGFGVDVSIHLWWLCLPAPTDVACLGEIDGVSDDERRRAERIRSPGRRHRFLVTRAWLRTILGHYLNASPLSISWEYGAYGKPRLADTREGEGLVFNLSHSGDFAVLAIACDTFLGVDIELPRRHRHLERLAASCLASEELAWWRLIGGEEARMACFHRLWACKEAFVKAVGRGIALGMQRVVVKADFSGFHAIPAEYGSPEQWHLQEQRLGSCHAAVVYRGRARPVVLLNAGHVGAPGGE